jgi:hypothetical protein
MGGRLFFSLAELTDLFFRAVLLLILLLPVLSLTLVVMVEAPLVELQLCSIREVHFSERRKFGSFFRQPHFYVGPVSLSSSERSILFTCFSFNLRLDLSHARHSKRLACELGPGRCLGPKLRRPRLQ